MTSIWVISDHVRQKVIRGVLVRRAMRQHRAAVLIQKRSSSFSVGLFHLSNEKNLGWLGYIRDYTTQLYRDYSKPL